MFLKFHILYSRRLVRDCIVKQRKDCDHCVVLSFTREDFVRVTGPDFEDELFCGNFSEVPSDSRLQNGGRLFILACALLLYVVESIKVDAKMPPTYRTRKNNHQWNSSY